MLVWKGQGFLSPSIIVIAVLVGQLAGPFGAVAGALAAAAANWFVGRGVNDPLRKSGATSGQLHSFFWVPMEYWSVAFLAYALFGAALATKLI